MEFPSIPTRTESTLVAVFGDPSVAEAAVKELVSNAFAGDHIHLISDIESSLPDRQRATYSAADCDEGLNNYFSAFCPQPSNAERHRYAEAVHEGKAVVAVSTPDQMVDRAAEILNHHAPFEAVVLRPPGEGEVRSKIFR